MVHFSGVLVQRGFARRELNEGLQSRKKYRKSIRTKSLSNKAMYSKGLVKKLVFRKILIDIL